MKKIAIILLAVLFAFAAVSCDGGIPTANQPGQDDLDQTPTTNPDTGQPGQDDSGLDPSTGTDTSPPVNLTEEELAVLAVLDLREYTDGYGVAGIADSYKGALVIPSYNENGKKIVRIDNRAFENNRAITSVSLPGTVEEIGINAFARTTLGSIELNEGLNAIGSNAFENATITGDIVIPSTVDAIGDSAFFASILGNVILENGVEVIESSAFANATIESIVIPGSVVEIGSDAFSYCNIKQSITLNDGLKTIGAYAFNGFQGACELAIPYTVKNVGEDAFYSAGFSMITIPFAENSLPEGWHSGWRNSCDCHIVFDWA